MKRNKTLLFAVPLMVVLVCVVVYKYGYLGIKAETASIREEQDTRSRLLQRYLILIAERPRIEQQLASLKAERKSDDSRLIEGQTPSLAAATLQETIKGIIVEKGGTISSERVGPPEDSGKFKIISVSIDAVLPNVAVLSEVLYSIETRTPYLIVKELDTRVRTPRKPGELLVKIDVSALTGGK